MSKGDKDRSNTKAYKENLGKIKKTMPDKPKGFKMRINGEVVK